MNDSSTTETVKVGKDTYGFHFDFDCLREIDNGRGFNAFTEAALMAEGEMRSVFMQNVIEVSITQINEKTIKATEAAEYAVKFIENAGLQSAHVTAQKLIAYCLVGDVKKSELKSLEEVLKELDQYRSISDSRLRSFTARLSSWAYRIGIFGGCLWLIFSEYGLRSLFKMV